MKLGMLGWIVGLSLLWVSGAAQGKAFLRFTGGPSGGTFQYFANGISARLSKQDPDLKVSPQASAGSTENLRRVNNKRAHFGVVHQGDLYLGRRGKLHKDSRKYDKVYALGVLYRSAAQLVASTSSGIKSLKDLPGKKVGIGGPGSGAAATAERFLVKVGLWDKIDHQFLGYSGAARAIKDGHLDAMWVVSGYPTRAVIELSASTAITMIPLLDAVKAHKFRDAYPFYHETSLPETTYEKWPHPYETFVDSTVWVAGAHTSMDHVYQSLKDIYSKEGLAYMVNLNRAASSMSVATAIQGVIVPLHPGAVKFWTEKGLKIPKNLMPNKS